MPWKKIHTIKIALQAMDLLGSAKNCHDCDATPNSCHLDNCDVERCSVCGGQRLMCECEDHDKAFARWTGFWPGQLECIGLGLISEMDGYYCSDLNTFQELGLHKIFFIKPKE